MKSLILILVSFVSLTASANSKVEAQTAVGILLDFPGVSIACIYKDAAYGFLWDEDSRSVVTVTSVPAKNFGGSQTIILDTLPGKVRIAIPESKEAINSDLIVINDAQGNPIALTYASMGKIDKIQCAYRADDVLYSKILQFESSGTLVLE